MTVIFSSLFVFRVLFGLQKIYSNWIFGYDGDEESFVEIINQIEINNEYSVDSSSSIGGLYILVGGGGGVDGSVMKMRLPQFMFVCKT